MESVYIKKAEKNEKFKKVINIQVFLMTLYILLNYIAKNTLLPPILSSISMYVFVAWTLLSTFVFKTSKTQIYKYTLWYVVLMVWSVMSFLWADNLVYGQVYNMAVSLIITFCFINTIDTTEKLDYFAYVYVCASDILCILIFATGQFVTEAEGGERLGGNITENANIFSSFLMVSAVFAAWLLIFKGHVLSKIFNGLSLAFILFMMAASGGRKTIIAVLLCLVYFFVTKDRNDVIKSILNIVKAAAIILILYLAVMKIPLLYESVGFRFEQLLSLAEGGTSDVSSDATRKKMIEIGFDAWLKKPIFGYGLDTFKYYNLQITKHFYYAHNNYVELLYDLGIIGFLLYYCFVGKLFINLAKIRNDKGHYKELGIGLIVESLIFDIGGVSYYTVLIQVVLCFAFICYRFGNHNGKGDIVNENAA